MKRVKAFLNLVFNISIIKTLYFNLKLFGIGGGLPILIYKRTEVSIKKHSVIFACKPSFGIIRIGMNSLALYPKKKDFSKFSVEGKICFYGRAHFYTGCRIIVQDNASLTIGNNFEIGGPSSIIATQNITIGNEVMVSWDTLIMDSDLHKIFNNEGEIINNHRDIFIGDNVWIGCRCCILKGSIIPDGNIISAGAFINKQFDIKNSILSSNRIIRENVTWEGKLFE